MKHLVTGYPDIDRWNSGLWEPVTLLACAIATQEGVFNPVTIPAMRNNPGDLRYESQLGTIPPDPPTSGKGEIAMFRSPSLGIAALYRQLWFMVAEQKTVREIVEQWDAGAPPAEIAVYLANVLQWTGLPADVPVVGLLPPLMALNTKL